MERYQVGPKYAALQCNWRTDNFQCLTIPQNLYGVLLVNWGAPTVGPSSFVLSPNHSGKSGHTPINGAGGHPVTATNSIAENRFGKSTHRSLSRTLLDKLLVLYQTNPKMLGFRLGAAVFAEKMLSRSRLQSTFRALTDSVNGPRRPGRRDLLH